MFSKKLVPLLVLALPTTAGAEELGPMQARSMSLGLVSGVAYYTASEEKFALVATLASGADHTPVRVLATLSPGQKVTISVPGPVGAPDTRIVFKRVGDKMFVEDAANLVALSK